MSEYRRDNEAWQRRKEYLIRSLFHDSPDLSTIREESDESTTAVKSPICSPPEPRRSYSLHPPQAHRDALWSPLPPLTIEKVKKRNKNDEPDEFYKRLERKILKIYRRIFFENRSDISDINTSDVDDTSTNIEAIGYSTNTVEFIDSSHDTPSNKPIDLSSNSIKSDKSPHDTSTYNRPIDLSLNKVKVLESTHQSVINDTEADQENENITSAGTENQQSNEEIELRFNDSTDDENRNGSDDDNTNNCDDDSSSRNLETNVVSDEGDFPNLKAKVVSDEEQVSSSTDVMANSTETDGGDRDSATLLSSTTVLSRATSDEELCLEINEVPANTTNHIESEASEIEANRTSSPRLLTASTPKAEANPAKENDVGENLVVEEGISPVSAHAGHQIRLKDAEIEEIRTSGIQLWPPSISRAEAKPIEENVDIENLAMEDGIPSVSANTGHLIRPEAAEIEEIKTSGRPLTASTPKAEANPAKQNVNIENSATEEDIAPVPAKTSLQKRPEATEIEEMITLDLRSSTDFIPRCKANPDEENDNIDKLAVDKENNEEIGNIGTSRPDERTPSEDMGDNASMDTDPNNNSLQSQVEEMRTPRPHQSIGSPKLLQSTISPTYHRIQPCEPNIVIIEHKASLESETYSTNEDEIPTKPNNPKNIELFDSIRLSSPKDIITEVNTEITNPEDNIRNISHENDDVNNICPEDNLGDIIMKDSPQENNRKRKSSPCRCVDKRVRLENKSVQTDYFNKYIYKYKYRYKLIK